MTVSAVLAASVTNHQVIILLAGKIASASMTTFSTYCISMRIKTIYIRRVQAEVWFAAESLVRKYEKKLSKKDRVEKPVTVNYSKSHPLQDKF